MKKGLKKLFIPGIYLTAVVLVLGCVYLTVRGVDKFMEKKNDFSYSINSLNNDKVKPVQATDNEGEQEVEGNVQTNTVNTIIRPYTSDKVSIGRYFYDFEGEEDRQVNSIIFYENTYMQNTGVDYISEEVFDVISVLPGKVESIETDEVLGNIVKISHDKDIISVYQGIDKSTLKVGDVVEQGSIVGTSGTSTINSKYPTSLHFEVYYKGSVIDPENFYTLNINDL